MFDDPWKVLTAIGTVGAVFVAILGAVWRGFRSWYRRPRLVLHFENREPWVRSSVVEETDDPWRFFRFSVENVGLTIAHGVKAWLAEFTLDGRPCKGFDPFQLHWVGTEFDATPVMNLLPGQKEYVDVFKVSLDSDVHVALAGFELIPQVAIRRGLRLGAAFVGQRFLIRVSGENTRAVSSIEFQVPDRPSGNAAEVTADWRVVQEDPSLLRALRSSWVRFKRGIESET